MSKLLTVSFFLLAAFFAQADGIPGAPEEGEPQIRITHQEDKTQYEYRVNGVLKEIKVVPVVGKPYYLVPSDEDGKMVRVEASSLSLPKWVIFRW